MSERWLLQKSRRERYAVRGDVVEPRGVEPQDKIAILIGALRVIVFRM